MEKSPCYKLNPCPNRSPDCHSICETFKVWKKEHEAERERIREEKERENRIVEAEIRRAEKQRKKWGRSSRRRCHKTVTEKCHYKW